MNNQLTVTELNRLIRRLLEQDGLLQNIWVRGEISNFKDHTSGHAYFTIKDERSAVRCVMFRSYRRNLQFQPQNGQQIVAFGSVGMFERDGQVQLYVENILPEGIGSLYEAFEKLKQQLQAEGLFDRERKRQLPRYPTRVGLVTSPTSAAVQDMIRIINRRAPWVHVCIFPCLVQGEEAAVSIVNAIRLAEKHSGEQPLDLLIVGRGGGSIEELWPYNTEPVARAIAACSLPIISAVGHETDVTLADFVADVRAATPSMAAEIAVPDRRDLLRQLSQWTQRLNRAMQFGHQQQQIDQWEQRIILAISHLLRRHRDQVGNLAMRLDDLSPLSALQRGYSVCMNEYGTIIRDIAQVSLDEKITVRLQSGVLKGRIEEIVESDQIGQEGLA